MRLKSIGSAIGLPVCFPVYCTVVSIVVSTVAGTTTQAKLAPGISGAASIVPGLGQTLNGEPAQGALWFFTSVGALLSGNRVAQQVGFDLWMYNMYDAYRGAGGKDTRPTPFYQYVLAPFNPVNLIDPIAAPVLGLTAFGPMRYAQGSALITTPLYFTPVGIGEEGLFRGFLFPEFSDLMHSKWVGAISSSAAFSAFHLVNQTAYDHTAGALLFRFLMGLLFCWQTSMQQHDLRESIFTHTWFDTLVSWKGSSKAQTMPSFGDLPENQRVIVVHHQWRF